MGCDDALDEDGFDGCFGGEFGNEGVGQLIEALARFAGEEEAIGAETVTQIVAGGVGFGGIRFGAARFGTVGAGGGLLGFCAF